ncbi:MAG: 23S rRNA (guanosine(2251)-2'-O)-methyltransferase RlmB [Dethiobacter sp.]|jgi:23S rRNA (guanosine2251-2'-O)-methyltransferase|nr:23S rRNA (guanosine(2251)-2'-O)-methyltransferase RlmB [Dethiobacter sp.]
MDTKRMIEGRRPVLEALLAGTAISRIICQQGTTGTPLAEIEKLAKQQNIPLVFMEKAALDRLSVTRNHQGVLAEAVPFVYTPLAELLNGRDGEPPFLLVLDHLQDPHNLGALLRSAYAAGCHGIIIPERRAAQVTPAAVKTAAGAAEHLPVARVVNVARCLEECKQAGLWVYGAEMAGDRLYTEGDYRGGTVLVVGAEGSGLSRLVSEKCDFLVQLPMKGKLASLNASVAGALLLYEVYRQRLGL